MTYPPGPGGQWQPPGPNQNPAGQSGGFPQQAYPQQGGYPQQGYPQTGPQPAQGYPQTGPQPAQGGYPQQGYQQGGYPGGYPQTGPQQAQAYPLPPQPPQRKRKGLVIGAVATVVAVAAATGITVWALHNSSEPVPVGAPDPIAAATNLVSTLGKGDIAGLATTLAPAEASLVRDQLTETVAQLKRLDVLKQDADPGKVSGVEITTKDLKFDDGAAEHVNDHVTITKLVGGTVTVNEDFSKVPLTDDFLQLVFPRGNRTRPHTRTIDIAREIQHSNHGEPVRIATVRVDGQWYPSLFYTVTDYALRSEHLDWPKQSIPAEGAASPGEAVRNMAQAGLDGDLRRVISLLPPDELGAVHDAGQVLVDKADLKPSGAKIITLETDTSDVTGGTKVTLRKIVVQGPDGKTYTVQRQGDCFQFTGDGENKQLCGSDLVQQITRSEASSSAMQALQHLVTGMARDGIGVVATQSDGRWYVSPFRSFGELGLTALRSLQPGDIQALIRGLH